MATTTNNMAVTRPDLAAEFHPTKHGTLTPLDVKAGTGKLLWWKCPLGTDHEWQATGNSRFTMGSGCPVCAGRLVTTSNNLAATHPDLAAEYHPTKNAPLAAADVVAGTTKRLWWSCPKGPDHVWQATGNSRVGGTGCPFCRGLKVSVTNCLANVPTLAAQFDPDRNVGLTPNDVVAGTHKMIWWRCPEGPDHVWQATGHGRLYFPGCPFCLGQRSSCTNSLARFPMLVAEFHQTKNGDLTPEDVVAGTGKRLWWKCPKGSDHEWRATGAARMNGHGCPACANKLVTVSNSLSTTHPDLAAEFHPTKNGDLKPADLVAGTGRSLWWKCNVGPDHEWRATGASRVAGTGCPACAGQQLSVTNSLARYPDLVAEFHPTKNGGLTPADVLAGTSKKIWWRCSNDPLHEWKAVVAPRIRGVGCPSCATGGFDPAAKGWLYLMEHPTWKLLQIGITNDLKERTTRHERSGWGRLDQRGPMDGTLARAWEASILKMLREKGIKADATTDGGRFDGYTESWPQAALPVQTIRELLHLVETNEVNIESQ